jgi:Cof subfamily protein (haloacid dehalogenase superfamily)
MKLFATDLDGTLLDREGRIHQRDREAIDAARARGVIVTIATGRLTSGTHPVARSLGLDAPLVCADGGVTACGATERILDKRHIDLVKVDALLGTFVAHDLACFVFTHDTIHSCERGRAHHGYVMGWTTSIATHADVLEAEAWRLTPDAAIMVVGIGHPEAVARAMLLIREQAPELEAATFILGPGRSVLRILGNGVSKGAALAEVARKLGVARADVAVIGDWLNDVSMFRWAHRSFAMWHAPEEVASVASDRIDEESCRGGAIAVALERWLADER